MHFSKATVIFSLAFSATTLPTSNIEKGAGVLTKQSYAQFQVSDGKAGNALAEVQNKFPIDMTNAASVDPADLQIIEDTRKTAESAETDAFNPAIEKATGDGKIALQNGKIKNKVLKLQLETMALQIDQAANGKDNAAKIKQEQTKLENDIATNKRNAGLASQSVTFTG